MKNSNLDLTKFKTINPLPLTGDSNTLNSTKSFIINLYNSLITTVTTIPNYNMLPIGIKTDIYWAIQILTNIVDEVINKPNINEIKDFIHSYEDLLLIIDKPVIGLLSSIPSHVSGISIHDLVISTSFDNQSMYGQPSMYPPHQPLQPMQHRLATPDNMLIRNPSLKLVKILISLSK